MRRVVAIVILGAATGAGLATALAAKKDKPAKREPVEITKASDGNSVGLRTGQVAVIRLAGNPTTGYSWFLASIKGDAVKAVGKVEYAPTPVNPGRVGSGGTFSLKLQAVKTGQGTVHMEYKRPWEKKTKPIETFTVTLNVRAPAKK